MSITDSTRFFPRCVYFVEACVKLNSLGPVHTVYTDTNIHTLSDQQLSFPIIIKSVRHSPLPTYQPIRTSTDGHSANGTAMGFSRHTLTSQPLSRMGCGLSPMRKSSRIFFAMCVPSASSVSKDDASNVYSGTC